MTSASHSALLTPEFTNEFQKKMETYLEKEKSWKASFQTDSIPYHVEHVVRALYHYPIYLSSEVIPELQEEGGEDELIHNLQAEIPECYALIERVLQHKDIPRSWYESDEKIANILGQACVHFLTCNDEWIVDNTSAQSRLLGMLGTYKTNEQQKYDNARWAEALKYNTDRWKSLQNK